MRFENQVSIYDTDAILRKFDSQETKIEIVQGKISAIISESELLELQGGSSTMYGKLADVELSVDGLSGQFSTLSAGYDTLSGQYTSLDSRVTAYKATADGLSVNVASIQTNLSTNYSTTSEMRAYADDARDAAISAAASDATTKAASAISTAAADATTKANNALSSANANTASLLQNYSTTTEMNSAINTSASGISANVSSAVSRIETLESWREDTELRITSSAIVSTVTSSNEWGTLSSRITQNANAIETKITSADAESLITQKADSIRLKAGSISWSSSYSSMTADGTLTCENANIKGIITGSAISGSSITSVSNYGFRKAVMDRAYLEFYDMNPQGVFEWAGAIGPGTNYPSRGAEDMAGSPPDALVIDGKTGVDLLVDGSNVLSVGVYSNSYTDLRVDAYYTDIYSTSTTVYGNVYLSGTRYIEVPDGDVLVDGMSVKNALYWVYARMDGGLFDDDDDDSGELIGG